MRVRLGLNPESERISRSLTSTSSIRPEPFGSELKADLLMAEGSRVAAGIFNEAISCEILVFVSLCAFVGRFFVGSSLSKFRY